LWVRGCMQKHFPADNLQQRGGNAQPAPIFVRLVKHFVEVSSGFVRKGWKGSVYEGGLRVPMIVRYPGKVKAGARSDTPGYFADWFPTLCEATGLETPDGLDGESLWPVITGGESKAEQADGLGLPGIRRPGGGHDGEDEGAAPRPDHDPLARLHGESSQNASRPRTPGIRRRPPPPSNPLPTSNCMLGVMWNSELICRR